MVSSHHQLNGHKCEQALGDGEGQGSLTCCSPWGHKESDTTDQLNNNNHLLKHLSLKSCLMRVSSDLALNYQILNDLLRAT